jgi:hypothetical protein
MAAGLGFKTFATGDVLTAADTNGYLMQGVWVFANAAARDAAVTSPQEGNVCYLKSTDAIMTYSGSAWVAVGGASTFVGVNATRTNVSTTITANTPLVISFTTEEFDSNGFHDNSTNNSRLTIPTGYAGKYIVSGWLTNALGTPGSYQLLRILKNGTQYTGGGVREGEYIRSNTGSNVPFGFAQTISAAVGDYFELSYQQNNGETVNIWSNFQLTYVGA